jgi:DNA-binding NtrC family response regulator
MSPKQRILVVDDEKDVITGFRRVFQNDEIEIDAAYSGEAALLAVKQQRPDLVVMDLRMPGMDGLQTLKKMNVLDSKMLIILMTAFSTSATVIEAMKYGAYDYLVKPFSVEKLREVILEALKVAYDTQTVVNYEPRLGDDEAGEMIIGKSDPMQDVYKMIGQVASSNATVLITGESGTGKELVARAVFSHSERSGKPFIAVNCAAIPEALLESELFGHERGAFTNATNRRIGKFELANDGTLFLDEIGDMSLVTQTKILRVLQSGEFERIGGTETVKVDVRILAATNRNLETMMNEGKFRPDLFYRLNVVRVEMPALKSRREDIPILAEYFLRRCLSDRKNKELNISTAAMEKMTGHSWPGNVRELENTIRNAVLTTKSDTILSGEIRLKEEGSGKHSFTDPPIKSPQKNIPLFSRDDPKQQATAEDARFKDIEVMIEPLFETLVKARERGHNFSTFDVIERGMLIHALNSTRGNQLQAAKLLGITRSTLRKRITRYGIQLDTKVKRG